MSGVGFETEENYTRAMMEIMQVGAEGDGWVGRNGSGERTRFDMEIISSIKAQMTEIWSGTSNEQLRFEEDEKMEKERRDRRDKNSKGPGEGGV